MASCERCGEDIAQAATGRPRRFCSDRCRRARHQRAKTLRRQVDRYLYLAAANAEPYSSYWASRAADAQAELSKIT
ncbi:MULTISPECIES: hypothetical protein [unclassified Streptomyces]|uniref:hypothetical protein n=1 Tax=unclassified Streptomyces TaxID=2593676 RepID=UPI003701B58A